MEIARHWRLQRQRYALVGEVCTHCGDKIFPARDVCPQCNAPAKTPFVFSGKGEVYSYSTVHHPPEGFERFAPYVVALVRLAEGPLVAAQLTDVEGEEIDRHASRDGHPQAVRRRAQGHHRLRVQVSARDCGC